MRAVLIWLALGALIAVPVGAAALSPLLEWRSAIYIASGFAGIAGLAALLVQPLLAAGALPGARGRAGRQVHRWIGGALVLSVVLHVVGLWITSPPDVIDVLLFRSPTPFSVWGVLAMWAVFASAFLAATRRRFRLRYRLWLIGHTTLAVVIVVGTVVHAMLIQGTMETFTKAGLCAAVLLASGSVIVNTWRRAAQRTVRRSA